MTLEQRRAVAMANARLRMQQQGATEQPAVAQQAQPEPDEAERLMGSPGTRFALGAAAPILGIAQIADEATGGNIGVSEHLKRVETMKKRGMTPAAELKNLQEARAVYERMPGYEAAIADVDKRIAALQAEGASADPKDAGFDLSGFTGTSLMLGGAMKGVGAAKTLGSKVLQGGGVGAAAGATTPVTDGDNFWGSKGVQTVTGALLGSALPVVTEGGKAVVRTAKDVANLFTDKGASRILTDYQNRIIGERGRDAVIDALKNAKEPVPGYKPTAAEAVAKVPEGSPIIAHQRITAQTPGGPSGEFGRRAVEQKAALEAARTARDAATTPMREAAISSANMGGVKSNAVTQGIDSTLAQPGIRANEVVGKTLGDVKDKIAKFTNEQGVIDANDLYTIRKEIGNTIQRYAKETSTWDKKLTGGLERDIQKAIDDAIEAAGGTGWKDYLREFSSRSAGIEAAKEGVKAAARPAQRTNLGGGMNVAEESRLHLPNMLSRPMMLANAVMRRVSGGIEPRIDAEATRRYLNPQELAKALESLPPAQKSVVASMLERMGLVGATTAAASQEQF
jgi:hypothetical protein